MISERYFLQPSRYSTCQFICNYHCIILHQKVKYQPEVIDHSRERSTEDKQCLRYKYFSCKVIKKFYLNPLVQKRQEDITKNQQAMQELLLHVHDYESEFFKNHANIIPNLFMVQVGTQWLKWFRTLQIFLSKNNGCLTIHYFYFGEECFIQIENITSPITCWDRMKTSHSASLLTQAVVLNDSFGSQGKV